MGNIMGKKTKLATTQATTTNTDKVNTAVITAASTANPAKTTNNNNRSRPNSSEKSQLRSSGDESSPTRDYSLLNDPESPRDIEKQLQHLDRRASAFPPQLPSKLQTSAVTPRESTEEKLLSSANKYDTLPQHPQDSRMSDSLINIEQPKEREQASEHEEKRESRCKDITLYYLTLLVAAPFEALTTSISTPVFAFYAMEFINEHIKEFDVEEYKENPVFLSTIYLMLSVYAYCNYRLQILNLANRADGKPDQSLSLLQDALELTPEPLQLESSVKARWFLGTLSQFTNGFLTGAAIAKPLTIESAALGFTVGMIKLTSYWLIEMQSSYRKFLEKNPTYAPIANQTPFNQFYKTKVGEFFAWLMVNGQAPFMNYAHVKCTKDFIIRLHGENPETTHSLAFFAKHPYYIPLLLTVALGTAAYTMRFDVQQLLDNARLGGIDVNDRPLLLRGSDWLGTKTKDWNACARFPSTLLQAIPKIFYGELQEDLVASISCLDLETQKKVFKTFNSAGQAIGLGMLIHTGINDYVFSGVRNNQVITQQYPLNPARSIKAYNRYGFYIDGSLSALGGLLQTSAKSGEAGENYKKYVADSVQHGVFRSRKPANPLALLGDSITQPMLRANHLAETEPQPPRDKNANVVARIPSL